MTLRDSLRQNNLYLLREIEQLLEIISCDYSAIPQELYTYSDWVINALKKIRCQVNQNIEYLDLGQDIILTDILSSTQKVTHYFRLFNKRLVSPILRVRPADRLCLKLLQWLHLSHPQTSTIPAAVIDGEFASWPNPSLPTIYFIPSSIQHGLLYLPILFHEFGHLLYACHKPEMDELVGDLQKKISPLLEPGSQRDDLYAEEEIKRRNTIVETWYEWSQEIFCDAVGFVIGGTAFIHAFSMYLRMWGRGQYHLGMKDLSLREHPVTWLRIRLLAERARQMNYGSVALKLEETWSAIAEVLGVGEDYYGFYEPDFLPAIQQTIDDMLVEAGPRNFTKQEVTASKAQSLSSSPIQLLNQAWHEFLENPAGYSLWEKSAINDFLTAA